MLHRLSVFCFVIALFFFLFDVYGLWRDGFDPNKWLPFVNSLVFVVVGVIIRTMTNTQEKPPEYTISNYFADDPNFAGQKGPEDKIPAKAKQRTNAPDGLGG